MCRNLTVGIIAVALATALSYSCKEKKVFQISRENRVISISHAPSEMKNNGIISIPYHRVFNKDYKLLPLTPDSTGMGIIYSLQGLYPIHDNWLAFNSGPSGSNLFLFDENGNFIKEIGKKGRGPGEMIHANICKVNYDVEQIQVFDLLGRKLVIFDFNGNHLKSIKSNFVFSDFVYDAQNERYFLYTLDHCNVELYDDSGLSQNYLAIIADKNLNFKKGITPVDCPSHGSSPLSNNKNKFIAINGQIGIVDIYSNRILFLKGSGEENLDIEIDDKVFAENGFIEESIPQRSAYVLKQGKSLVYGTGLLNSYLLEHIMTSTEKGKSELFTNEYFIYNMKNKKHIRFNKLFLQSDCLQILSLDLNYKKNDEYSAFGQIIFSNRGKKDCTEESQLIEDLKLRVSNNPVICLFKFNDAFLQ